MDDKTLQSFLDALVDHYTTENAKKVETWERIALDLSDTINHRPVWGWRYVQAVHAGTQKASANFSRSVEMLAATIDGLPKSIAHLESVTVFADPGKVKSGSIIGAASKRCNVIGCSNWFVSDNVFRHKCFICSPPGSSRKKRR